MHYSVAVITKNSPDTPEYEQELEQLLAPYSEHLEVEPYIDQTFQEIVEYARKLKEKFTKKLRENPDAFYDKWDLWKKQLVESGDSDQEIWNIYTSHSSSDSYDEHGNELSPYNPKSKWDWYAIGGRWSGEFDEQGRDAFPVKEWRFSKTKEQLLYDADYYKVVYEDAEYSEMRYIKKDEYDRLKEGSHMNPFREDYNSLQEFLDEPINIPFEYLTPDGVWHERPECRDFDDDEVVNKHVQENKEFIQNIPEVMKQYQDCFVTFVDCHI